MGDFLGFTIVIGLLAVAMAILLVATIKDFKDNDK